MTRRSVLTLVPGQLGDSLTGPEIRGWELSRALSEHGFEVTLAAPDTPPATRDGVAIIPRSRVRAVRESTRHGAVLAPRVPPYLFPLLSACGGVAVADLYDPVDLEHAEDVTDPAVAALTALVEQSVRIQLLSASIVTCASPAQRERLLELAAPLDVDTDKVLVVPFGIAPAPEPSSERPLRRRFPEIGERDPLVLWWGSIWRWFDAATAIRAFRLLADDGSPAKLVMAAGKSPRKGTEMLSELDATRDLANSLGVLGRNVFILDEWIPFDSRHTYLCEADLGLTLHRDAPESRFAARARYMDYLWTTLPTVLNGGDTMADEFGAAGFSKVVPVGDARAAADAIKMATTDTAWLAGAREAGSRVAERFGWQAMVQPLAERLENASPVCGDGLRRRLVATELPEYYRRWMRLRGTRVRTRLTRDRPSRRPEAD